MIDTLFLVGIGTGSPGHMTLEGQAALQRADVILVPHKGRDKDDLARIRMDLLSDMGVADRVRGFDYPVRDPDLPYQIRVARWHDAIAKGWQEALGPGAPHANVALLVWGDPAFYDSTLRIAERLRPRPALRVLPGITAVQALTAAHAVPLNTIDGRILTTTGRRIRDEGWPDGAESVVVVLDGACSFQHLTGQGLQIWWGAFLGMPQQILDHGPLDSLCNRIIETRAKAREQHGWVMDTYLLRKIPPPAP